MHACVRVAGNEPLCVECGVEMPGISMNDRFRKVLKKFIHLIRRKFRFI